MPGRQKTQICQGDRDRPGFGIEAERRVGDSKDGTGRDAPYTRHKASNGAPMILRSAVLQAAPLGHPLLGGQLEVHGG